MSNSDHIILLSDIGGTHVRFARYEGEGAYSRFKKYKLHDFDSFDQAVQRYMTETGQVFTSARFSTAIIPVNGIASYTRYDGERDYPIDFNALEKKFDWKACSVLMDSTAAGYAMRSIHPEDADIILKGQGNDFRNGNKVLLAVGTGIFHALTTDTTVSCYTDGHYLPVTVTEEQRKVEAFIRAKKDKEFSLIMEDFVSARGLRSIAEYITGVPNEGMSYEEFAGHLRDYPDAIRLFFEFLGLYAHNVVSVTGFYGGVYLSGGVIDMLIRYGLTDWDAFVVFFRPPMLPIVNDRLASAGVYYVTHNELPLLGLTMVGEES